MVPRPGRPHREERQHPHVMKWRSPEAEKILEEIDLKKSVKVDPHIYSKFLAYKFNSNLGKVISNTY